MHTTITGRSSSSFTRIVRIFAAEFGIDYAFEVVRDLGSGEASLYAGNPALKIPVLRNDRGTWFGAQPICRELQRQSQSKMRILWPEHLSDSIISNAQELVLHAMSTEVNVIMAKAANAAIHPKNEISLDNSLHWLNANLTSTLDNLTERDLSFLEVSLFCLVRHLEFRKIRDLDDYANLLEFCMAFERRPSAMATPFRFDA